METDSIRSPEVLVKEELDPVSVRKMLLCKFLYLRIMHKSQRRYRARQKTQATLHPFRRSKRKLALPEHVLERVDGEFLMAFEYHKVMPVSLMVAEKEILAVDRIEILPVFQGKFYGRKRRMDMQFIFHPMLLEKAEDSVYSFVSGHLLKLFA